jgi:hypothetical protein
LGGLPLFLGAAVWRAFFEEGRPGFFFVVFIEELLCRV